ncbi:MAG: twin-arginine translocase subunit TatC [bacterium]|nr:twin-arginine translocase subunit TatC [bacterium]
MQNKIKKETLPELSLLDHLTELRHRIIHCLIFFCIAFIFCYSFKDEIYNLITYPLLTAIQSSHTNTKLIYTKITENFVSTFSIIISSAIFVSIPYWAIELWLFITPALYKEEKKFFFPYIFLTPILFLCGVIFCYFLVLPKAFEFFITFSQSGRDIPLLLQAKITDYIDFTTSLLNAFGICFLTPIFLILLVKFGLLNRETLKKNRKYAIVIIFTISAILTPPDVLSQILLAIPLISMYEISILLSKKAK